MTSAYRFRKTHRHLRLRGLRGPLIGVAFQVTHELFLRDSPILAKLIALDLASLEFSRDHLWVHLEEYGAQFEDEAIVRAYRHREPYPEAVFAELAELAGATRPRVLALRCGTGDLTIGLTRFAASIDASDPSAGMIRDGSLALGSIGTLTRGLIR